MKDALISYSKIDKWNRNSEYRAGFNDDAQAVIDEVANMNVWASEVAKSVQKYNYTISEKQAYVIARAALDNKAKSLITNKKELKIIFKKTKVKPKPKTASQLKKAAETAHMPKKDNLVAAMKRRGISSSIAWKVVNANYSSIAKSVTGGSTSEIVELFMKKV